MHDLFHSHPVAKGRMSLLLLFPCKVTVSLSWRAVNLQDKTQAHERISLVGIHGKNVKGILAAIR